MDLNPRPDPWRPSELLVVAYGAFVSTVAVTRLGQRDVWLVLLAHLAIAGLPFLVRRAGVDRTARVLRVCFPLLLLPACYSSIDILNGFGSHPVHDAAIQGLEQLLFGGQPSRDWWRAHPSPVLSTLFHAAYFSYYLIVPLPLVVLLLRGRLDVSRRYVDGVMATFLFCYATFILFPVAGPYYAFAAPTGAFVANLPARLVYGTLAGGSAFGAAFPSSHIAGTLAAVIGTWRASRRMAAWLLIPMGLMAVGVVYCQMHYAVDSVSGVLVGIGIPMMVRGRT